MVIDLIRWYVDHAVVLFALVMVVAIIGEKIRQLLRRADPEWRTLTTSIVSGLAFLAARGVLAKLVFVALGLYLYEHFRITTLDLTNPLVWLGAFMVRDFVYYCMHRAEHGVKVLWASHLVHHSPTTIGMATAIRLPWMEAAYQPLFALWFPLVGFHPVYAIAFDVFATTIAQCYHTRWFRPRPNGLLQKVFVTASHHRVHHGTNAEYRNKNFGSVLIVWDRLFGTFEPERAEVRYGLADGRTLESPRQILLGGYPDVLRR